jgi:hypothetical protein
MLGVLSALAIAGCGGSDGGGAVAPTPRCVRPSDCSGALVCVQGYCVQQCVESKDCPSGQRCIRATEGSTCQPPEKSTCIYTTECTQPLVCGIDQQCRAQCQGDLDCPSKQFCTPVSKLCADPTVDKNIDPVTHDFIGAVDGGAKSDTSAAPLDAGATSAQPDAYNAVDATKPDTSIAVDAPISPDAVADRGLAQIDVPAAGPDVNVSFDAPALPADGVLVTPSPSVRQGQINITITVTRAAGGLASAGLFDLGDLTARPQTGSTDTSLVLKVSVPHGAPLGKRTLRVATSAGVITAADVLEVTAITAGPTGVDTNAGSAASPFLTIKQAILVADVGDTIHLMDGTYNIKGGETWGYVIPDKLTVVGDSTAGTIIDGQGATSNPNGFNAAANLTLKKLSLLHFNYGIDVAKPSSTLTLEDVLLGNNSNAAVYVEQAAAGSTVNVLGKNTLIDQPGESAVYVYNAPNTTVNITDATVQGGSYVLYYAYNCGGGKLNVTGATIKQLATYNAIYMSLSSNTVGTTVTLNKATVIGNISYTDAKGGTMTITGSTITQKSGNGIDFAGSALTMTDSSVTMSTTSSGIYLSGAQATMFLKGVTVTGGGYGIQQYGAGSSAKLRGTTIQGTAYDAYNLQAGDLDLGTATESGDNLIAAPASTSYWCLNVSRPQGASGGNPITCSGTTLNGLVPTPGTIDASAGTVSLQPQRYYLTTGNKLIFY